jgi:hypothetical protein
MPDHRSAAYSTVTACEDALPGRLLRSKVAGLIPIGKCQDAGVSSNVVSWGISPNGELLTSVGPAEKIDHQRTASIAPSETQVTASEDARQHQPEIANISTEYTTVRVTRGLGKDAVATSYVVKRSN